MAAELDCPPPPKNFWTETAGGIFTQSLLAVLGVGGLGALLAYGLYRIMGTSHILRTPWKCKTYVGLHVYILSLYIYMYCKGWKHYKCIYLFTDTYKAHSP